MALDPFSVPPAPSPRSHRLGDHAPDRQHAVQRRLCRDLRCPAMENLKDRMNKKYWDKSNIITKSSIYLLSLIVLLSLPLCVLYKKGIMIINIIKPVYNYKASK